MNNNDNRNEEVEYLLHTYKSLFDESSGGDLAARKRAYDIVANHFYDLVTDFYRFGWGDSFHFAPRSKGESLHASLARCERFFADELGLGPGKSALDVGCGVGGPLTEIATYSGAAVTGINNNAYQVSKAEKKLISLGLADRCRIMKGDFMHMPLPESSFDGAYTLEATPHAPDKSGVYREVFRVLKPGGLFIGDEWCVTDVYDPDLPAHQRLKSGIEIGNALPDLATTREVVQALEKSGFEILMVEDMAFRSDPETPWYRALQGRDLTLTSFPRTPLGRSLTNISTRLLEYLRIFPRGTSAVSTLLNHAADDLVESGIEGIFTPLYYFKARKPG